MDRRVKTIKELLKERSYEINDGWLRDCVEYYLTTDNPNASDEEAMSFAQSQWALTDLREVCNGKGCLPKDLAGQKCTTLPGKYLLQVEKAYDISTSKYKQLEKIRNVSVENIEATEVEKPVPWEQKSNRMMQLSLTDGVQDVIAIEHKYIRSLNDNIIPGFKVMIKGPVTCRRGVILLEQDHFERLSGEVDSLLIKNIPENIFARALNLPENPDPYNDKDEDGERDVQDEVDGLFDDDFDVDMEAITQIEERPGANNNQRNDNKTKETRMAKKNPSSSIQGTKMMTSVGGRRSEALGSLPVCFEATVQNEPLDFPDDDDNDFMEIAETTSHVDLNDDYNQINEAPSNSVTANLNQGSNSIMKTSRNQIDNSCHQWDGEIAEQPMDDFKPGAVDEADYYDLLTQDAIEQTFKNFPAVDTSYSSNLPVENKKNGKTDFSKTLNDSSKTLGAVRNMNSQASTSTNVSSTDKEFKKPLPRSTIASQQSANKEIPKPRVNNKNATNNTKITDFMKKPEPIPKEFEFIYEIEKTKWTNDIIRKKIRGRSKKVSNFGKNETDWFVELEVKDGTGYLDVTVSSEVLTSIIGYSVAEFKSLKKMQKTDPTITKRLQEALQRCNKTLSQLDAFLDIEFSPSRKPVVVKITELTETDRDNFKKLLQQHGYP